MALSDTTTNTVDTEANQRTRATTTRTNRGSTDMTQEEIISMARQAGFVVTHIGDPIGTNYIMIETFAKLVAVKEREACAKECDDIDAEYEGEDVLATWCSRAIRARGEA